MNSGGNVEPSRMYPGTPLTPSSRGVDAPRITDGDMLAAPIPADDEARVAALRELGVLDSAPDPAFDAITALASRVLGVPIALVSLVDAHRQWFLSRRGLDAPETPRDASFCGHVVASGDELVVPDAHADQRFWDNPLVIGPPHVGFYAACPVRDSDGRVLGTLCAIDRQPREMDEPSRAMLRNLAGHVEALLRLRQAANRAEKQAGELRVYERFFADGPDMKCTTDAELRLTRVNEAWAQVLGWSTAALLGRSLFSLFHPDDVARTAAEALRIRGAGASAVNFENRVQHAEGRWVPVAWVATHRDGEYYASARDMTQFREEQARVAAGRAQLREILDTVPDAVVTAREDGTVIEVNPALRSLLLIQPGGPPVRAQTLGDYGRGWPPDTEGARAQGAPSVFEGAAYRADGTSFPAEFHVGRTDGPDGRVYACVIRDILERDRVSRLQSEFVSTVSHELRTPLTAIRGSLGLIAGGVTGEIPATAAEYVDIALASCDRLVRLLNDILDMEKIQAGRMQFQPQILRIDGPIHVASAAVEALASRGGVRVEIAADDGAGEVLADEDRLVQVVTNLLSNAVKFSPSGGTVSVSARRREGWVRVAIRDRGPGIPPTFRSRLFQRFAQADASDRRERGGTGLGLSIAQALVENMQGRIGVEHPVDGGSLFYFELPRVASPAEYAADTGLSRGLALVVDDEVVARDTVAATAVALGLATHAAPTLARARELLAVHRYDLVTLDLRLPDGDGLSLVPAIRSAPGGERVAIVIVSGCPSRALGGAAVVTHIVSKPLDLAQINAVIRSALCGASAFPLRVLHVEDEPSVRAVVRGHLPPEWRVTAAGSLAEARRALEAFTPDVILLDLCLPDGPGEGLLDRTGALPVVIFSASAASEELSARVAAVLLKTQLGPEQLRDIMESAVARSHRHASAGGPA